MEHKSLASLHILKILKKYSDKEHLLTQNQIASYLERDYDITIERKTVARNLDNLTAAGYQIEQTPKGVYLEDEREFDDSELRLLIDSVLFSKHISANYARALIDKLQKLGSVDLRRSLGGIRRVDQIQRRNFTGLFYTIELISSAINENRRVRFVYNEYRLDKQLHPVPDSPIEVSPYRLFAANGHYYMLGVFEKESVIESFRIEKITGIEMADVNVEHDPAFDIDAYIRAHPYLYPGQMVDIKIKMNNRLAGELIDAFGDRFTVLQEGDSASVISLQAGWTDVLNWAKRFAEYVEVLSPQSLRNELRKISFPTAGKYFHSEEDRYVRCLEYLKKQEQYPDTERVFHFDGIDLSKREECKRYTFCNVIELRNNHLADMSFFSSFGEIVKADIEKNPVSDLSFLRGRTELRKLILKDTEVTDISFLEGTTGLTSLEFKGKKIEDISYVYGLFQLQDLTIDPVNAMQFDLLRLKRSCPNLRLQLESIGADTPLEKVAQLLDGNSDFLLEYLRRFGDTAPVSAYVMTKTDIEAVLSFLEQHDRFCTADLQRALQLGYHSAAPLIQWMKEADYIKREEGGFYSRKGREA